MDIEKRIADGWIIGPCTRRSGFGPDSVEVEVEGCAWVGSPDVASAHQDVRGLTRPCKHNLNAAEVQGILTDLGAGLIRATKIEAVDSRSQKVTAFLRIPRRGEDASDKGAIIPPPSRSSDVKPPTPPSKPIATINPPPAPGYTSGTPEIRKVRALIRVDLGSARLVEERLIRGEWKVAPPELIPALDFMGVESRKSATVGWRVCLVQGDSAIQVSAGETTAATSDEAAKLAYAAALASVEADPVPPLPDSTPEAPKEAGTPIASQQNGKSAKPK